MAERNIDATLKTSLLNNDAFSIMHLIKFEKPKPTDNEGEIAGIATDYTYITDAPYNVSWDDSSVDALGNSNGTQNYIANKILGIGSVQETTEAVASTMSIKLSTIALGTTIGVSGQVDSGIFKTNVDLVEAGFSEGDKVKLESSSNAEHYVRFDRFVKNASDTTNAWVYFTDIDGSINNDGGAIDYTVTLASEELNALTIGKNETLYSNYINREVFIYRAHLNPSTGAFIGAPFLLFRGIIAQGSVQENADREASITWALSSHWGDFVRVQGRLTSDAHHRALNITGKSDKDALIKDEYASDYGFMHSERSVNLLGTYQVQELRYKTKKRGGLAGLLGGKKVVEYYETVDRNVDLRFNLSAIYLPVVYGVQKVSSIPIFADLDVNDPKQLYVAYALCEGEIGGIYDIHVDQQSSVCLDEMDEAVRDSAAAAIEENNVDVVCYGRADRGDVIKGAHYVTGAPINLSYEDFNSGPWNFFLGDGAWFGGLPRLPNFGVENNTTGQQGLTHETTYTFDRPIDATFVVHTGKPDQEADEVLVGKAAERSFKVQADYFEGDPANYWSTSHRLLDTANVTAKFTLGEGEESIPDYEFVVKGKYVECYNYDHSFKHDPTESSEDSNDFEIGDTVDIKVGGVTTHSSVQIIDKWTIYDRQGNADVRFRWRTNYPAGGDTLVNIGNETTVQMVQGADTWSMITTNYAVDTGDVTAILPVAASSASYTDSGGIGVLTITLNTGDSNYSAMSSILSAAGSEEVYVALTTAPDYPVLVTSYSAPVITLSAYSAAGSVITNAISGAEVFLANAINVDGAPAIALEEDYIEVTRVTNNVPDTKFKSIAATAGSVVFTSTPFSSTFVPGLDTDTWTALGTADTYELGPANDERVTINPATQLLDYVTSNRYGRGLNIVKDINLNTWLESARLCDDQSKVKVVTTASPVLQDIYQIRRPDSSLIFQGRVVEINQYTYNSNTYYEITFDDVIGKLGYKWNSWRTYQTGDIVWGFDKVSIVSTGTLTQAAFLALPSVGSVSLSKVSGSGPGIISVSTARLGGVKNTNSLVRGWTEADEAFSAPGYSLHDSDDVKYWKYIGWDEPEQRYVTRHQTNQVINTNTPIFDNINSMLLQFNGILRYSNGKYELDIKTAQPASFTPGINSLSEADLQSEIKINDKGQKNSFNSISASIIDPQNKFASRAISFFNSAYLREDRGVPKQGTYSMPGITNYFTARTNIVQFLDQSRYGLEINVTADPKAYTLLAGEVIVFNYKRFNWEEKAFRIDTINLKPDGFVDIVASEHNNDAFLIDYSDRSFVDQFGNVSNTQAIEPPTNLTATDNLHGEIQLSWNNSPGYSPVTHLIEIYAAEATKNSDGTYVIDSLEVYEGNDFENATLIDHTIGNRYVHDGLGNEDLHVWFYWIRYVVPALKERAPPRYSPFEPLSSGDGVQGIAFSGSALDALTLILSNETHVMPADKVGNVLSYLNSGTDIRLFEGGTELEYDGIGIDNGKWTVSSVVDTNIIAGDINPVGSTGIYAVVEDHNTMISDTASVVFNIEGKRVSGEAIDLSKAQTLAIATTGADGDQGSDGVDAKAVKLTITPSYVIVYDQNEENPVPSGTLTLTATSQNIDNPVYKFTGDGLIDQTEFSATDNYSWTIPADYFNTPNTVQVEVADGDVSNPVTLAFDTVAIVAVHPGTDGADGVAARSVVLSAPTLAFTYDTEGLNPEHPNANSDGTLTITATAYNTTGTPYYNFILNDVSQQHNTTNTWDYTPQPDAVDMPDKIEVELREGGTGNPVLSRDQMTIFALHYGVDALTVILTNEAHSVPYDPNLDAYDYSNSGTDIYIYEGAVPLYYDGIGTSPRNWRISSITDINIVASTPTDPAGTPDEYAIMPDHSGWEEDSLSYPSAETAAITYEFTGQRLDGTTFTIEKRQSFALSIGGESGESARGVVLSAVDLAFVYDSEGNNPTPLSSLVTATPQNYSNTPYYEFFVDGVSQGAPNVTNTFIYTPPVFGDMPDIVSVEMREDSPTAAILATDQITMIGLRDGTDSIGIVLTNEAHTLPTTSGGTVDYTGSGTEIRVFEGTSELTYDGVGNDPGTWTIGTPTTSVTLTTGAISGTGSPTHAIVAQHSGMDAAAKVVTITYPISGTRIGGATFSIDKIQSLGKSIDGVDGADGADGSDGDDGRVVSIVAALPLVVNYDLNGNNPNPSTILLTAIPFNTTDTPYYLFYLNDVAQAGAPDTTATYSYTCPSSIDDLPETVEVELYEGGPGGPVYARDQISIYGLKQGGDAITVVLSNETHSIPTDSAGTAASGDYTGSGTNIRVYEGSTELLYDGIGSTASRWAIGSVTETNIDVGTISDGGSYAIVGNADNMVADTASLSFPISGKRADGTAFGPIVKTQTFAKSKAGFDGAAGADGENAIIIILSNEAHTVSADADGSNPVLTGSGTTIRVFEGNTELTWDNVGTTAGKWNASISASSGVTPDSTDADDPGSLGAIYGDLTAMSGDTGYIDYSISGRRLDNSAFGPIIKRVSFAKSKKGDFGDDAALVRATAANYIVHYNPDGTTPSPSSIQLDAQTQGFTNPYFRWTGGPSGPAEGAGANDSNYNNGDDLGGAGTDRRTFTPPSTYFSTPYNVLCRVREGAGTVEQARDSFTIAAVKDGQDGADGDQGPAGAGGGLAFSSATILNDSGNLAAFKIDTDGYVYIIDSSNGNPAAYEQQYQWLVSGNASDCVVWAELLGGTTPGGSTLQTFHNLGTGDRAWSVGGGGGTTSCNLQLVISNTVTHSSVTIIVTLFYTGF